MKSFSSPMKLHLLKALTGSALLIWWLTGCETTPLEMPLEQGYPLGSVSAQDHATARGWLSGNRKHYWNEGAAASGSDRIIINLPEQKAFYYRGGQLVGVSVVSTGREGYRTPTGNYRVLSKHAEHRSSLYGGHVDVATGNVINDDVDTRKDPLPPGAKYVGASMPYFLRLKHGPTGITSIGTHAGYLPGYPASHGCIRMPHAAAQRFFQEAAIGTPVVIENAKPDTSAPPATAPMLSTSLLAASYRDSSDMPAPAPNTREAKRLEREAQTRARMARNRQNPTELREQGRTSSGAPVAVTRYYTGD